MRKRRMRARELSYSCSMTSTEEVRRPYLNFDLEELVGVKKRFKQQLTLINLELNFRDTGKRSV